MNKTQKTKSQLRYNQQNVLEALRDIGTHAADEFVDQFLGRVSGDIQPGESVSMAEILFGQKITPTEKTPDLAFEKRILEEEKAQIENKSQQLKLQLQALMSEVKTLVSATQNVSQELKVASMQATAEPGIYHIIFFEKLLESLKSFRKKIENASLWLQSLNKRGQKKNYWARYQQGKGSFLLSAEHYLQRSAG